MVQYCRLLNVFKAFYCKIGNPHVFRWSGVKVTKVFSVIRDYAVTKRIAKKLLQNRGNLLKEIAKLRKRC